MTNWFSTFRGREVATRAARCIHRGKNEGCLRQPRRERAGEQKRILIALVFVEMMFRKRDRAESADIRIERKIGHDVEKRKFVPLVLDAGTEMHAKLHDNASRPFVFVKSRPAATAVTSTAIWMLPQRATLNMPINRGQGLELHPRDAS